MNNTNDINKFVAIVDDKHEQLINAFIGIDGPLQVMETYEEVTGEDPVTEDGQQTDQFRQWWLQEVCDAYFWNDMIDPKAIVIKINKYNRKDIVDGILDELWGSMIDMLEAKSIKYDASSSGDAVLYYNDTRKKKTYAVTISQRECEEYEGE